MTSINHVPIGTLFVTAKSPCTCVWEKTGPQQEFEVPYFIGFGFPVVLRELCSRCRSEGQHDHLGDYGLYLDGVQVQPMTLTTALQRLEEDTHGREAE